MHKWIAATVVMLIASAFGIYGVIGNAQESTTEVLEEEETTKVGYDVVFAGEEELKPAPVTTMGRYTYLSNTVPPRPGTWEIVAHNDIILLFSTATGQTFHLEDDEGMKWAPVKGHGHKAPRASGAELAKIIDPALFEKEAMESVLRDLRKRKTNKESEEHKKRLEQEKAAAKFRKELERIKRQLEELEDDE